MEDIQQAIINSDTFKRYCATMEGGIILSDKQTDIVIKYLINSKDTPMQDKLPIMQLLSLKKHIPKINRIASKPIEQTKETTQSTKGRKKKMLDNATVKAFLGDVCDSVDIGSVFSDSAYYWLDDIFTGVCRLDLGGNTRPLSKYLMLSILYHYDNIDSSIIMSECNVAIRQAQNIMQCLRNINRMIGNEIARRNIDVVTNDDVDW